MIKWAKRGRDLVITISGEFDLCMVPEFREKVDNLIDSNESREEARFRFKRCKLYR